MGLFELEPNSLQKHKVNDSDEDLLDIYNTYLKHK